MSYRVGVDVGGTFTDIILFDSESSSLERLKIPSSPDNPAVAVENGLWEILRRHDVDRSGITSLMHGTTVATNALLEGRGAPCALLVTQGFRDVLHIGRQDRPKLYDSSSVRPEPLVPRRLRYEIRERIAADGSVLVPLDEEQIVHVAKRLRVDGIRSIATCFLHSYVDPTHELRAAELIAEHYPEAIVSSSCLVLPEFREYERMSTTVVNAYVTPVIARYVTDLAARVQGMGIRGSLHVMQSNGGAMTARAASEKSVHTILSGPAAGVLGAVSIARAAGYDSVITFDMGGTSLDTSLAHKGEIRHTREGEVNYYPIRVPMVEVTTLGAGGGSIAWVDSGGALRVGPESAGADPGPACYGRGGTQATVTDANLVLGRLNPSFFAGGRIELDVEAAHAVIRDTIADVLGVTVEVAAEGIINVVNAAMAKGVRVTSVERGYDIRDFVLVAFGGGGPLHAAQLARELHVPRVLVPFAPGLTSALGLLMADFRNDYSQTFLRPIGRVSASALAKIYRGLEERAVQHMQLEGITRREVVLVRRASVRYEGQGYELELPVPLGQLPSDQVSSLSDEFHALHRQTYGYAREDADVEIVNVHVSAVALLPKPDLLTNGASAAARSDGRGQEKGTRSVYIGGDWIELTIFDREALAPGDSLAGPALLEQADSTTLVLAGQTARVDRFRNLVIEHG